MDDVRRIAQAVLYEGYLLWPYRRSALKNRQRWTIGGLHPRAYCAEGGDAWYAQTQCLVEAAPEDEVDVEVRFLHALSHDPARPRDDGHAVRLEPVPELTVGEHRYTAREEATEREVPVPGLRLGALVERPHRVAVDFPAGREVEWLSEPSGRRVGAIVRVWRKVRGEVEIRAERPAPGVFRLTVLVVNTSGWEGDSREEALRRTLLSCHMVVRARGGAGFVSLMDPPDALRPLAEGCRNVGVWPVLVGPPDSRDTLLSAPIILYDHPEIAPESPGDLFDATEIDQLLTLSVLSLTDEERREIRDGDPRAREILDRCAALTPEQLMRLHGTLRDIRPVQGVRPAAGEGPGT
ncbi:hypothetical protein [Microtetraspora niveoalba]|uniref:hypothetical protein n=1 Tax=Microtetraspora niveoalba TaxID=46175 RepID=UPI0009FBBCBB|nr:hypothetical protein [Microtetraspora niveoalba]